MYYVPGLNWPRCTTFRKRHGTISALVATRRVVRRGTKTSACVLYFSRCNFYPVYVSDAVLPNYRSAKGAEIGVLEAERIVAMNFEFLPIFPTNENVTDEVLRVCSNNKVEQLNVSRGA